MPNWKKVITSGSNAHLNHITASGNISVGGNIIHVGDPDTKIEFAADTIGFTAGNRQFLQFAEGTAGGDLIALGGVGGTPPIIQGHITASGNISASGELQATELHLVKTGATSNEKLLTVTEDGNERFAVDEDGDVTLDGNLTAGGNVISSNGIFKGPDADSSIQILDSGIFIRSNPSDGLDTNTVAKFLNTGVDIGGSEEAPVTINTNLTASNNISASSTTGTHTFGGQTTVNQITASAFQFVGSGDAELEVQGHITASGNISASFTSTGSFGTLNLEGTNFSSASLASAIAGGGSGGSTDLNGLSAGSIAVGDSIAFIDADDNSSKKEALADVVTLLAGNGIQNSANKFAINTSDISSILNASLTIGRDADNLINFATDNQMEFQVGAGNSEMILDTDGLNITAGSNSGSIYVSGSIEFSPNDFKPEVSASTLYNFSGTRAGTTNPTLEYNGIPIGPKQYEMITGAMNDDISTSKIYLPMNNNFEGTFASDEQGIVAPCSGSAKTLTVRPGGTLSADVVYTITFETVSAGGSTSSPTVKDSQQITLANANDNDPFTVTFDSDAVVAPGQVMYWSIQGDVDVSGALNYYFTAVMEWDYSTLPTSNTIHI